MVALEVAFRDQAGFCRELGSPMYEELLTRAADGLGDGGPLDRVLAGHDDDPGPSALALRLLGTVHRLVLERRAPALAVHYPSVGGTFEPEGAWAALLAVLDEQAADVAAGLERPPQTNEVARAAALVGALLRFTSTAYPLRLVEIGASGGLNLRADHYRYQAGDSGWGDPDSPVVLDDCWRGVDTLTGRDLRVVERLGCDPDPVDPTTTEGRTTLTSYVWPDMTARLERLRGALDVAARVPATVRRASAVDLVRDLEVEAGTCTVLWHSVVWQYLSVEEQTAVRVEIERLGEQSTHDAAFVHVWLEPGRRGPGEPRELLVGAEQFPPDPGWSKVLGTGTGHGIPVTWER